MVTRHRFGSGLNVYLNGSDEPIYKRFSCLEEAKDYVFRKLRIRRG